MKGLLQAPNRTRHDVRSSGIASLNPDDALLLSSLKALLDGASLKRRMMISQLISDTSSRLNVGRPIVEVEALDDVIALNAVSTLQWIPVLQEGGPGRGQRPLRQLQIQPRIARLSELPVRRSASEHFGSIERERQAA